MNWKKTLLISFLILLAGVAVTFLIFMTEPEAVKEGATRQTAMLVDVEEVKKGNFQPEIVATGTVQAAEDIMLSPRVGGEVIFRSELFIPGGFVRKGQTLLQIDPADFENTLELRKSELLQAEADLNLERGRRQVARQDYELIADSVSLPNEALVLRQPQLDAAIARVRTI